MALNPMYRIFLNFEKICKFAYQNCCFLNNNYFKLKLRKFCRSYCCYGNLLCHKNDNNVFTIIRQFSDIMILASTDKER